jgi:hypothetical protein
LPRKQNKLVENRINSRKIREKFKKAFGTQTQTYKNKICTSMNATNQIGAYDEF